MYDSYDLNNEQEEAKKPQKKSGGTFKKVMGTIGLACVFGVVSAFCFQATNKISDLARQKAEANKPAVTEVNEAAKNSDSELFGKKSTTDLDKRVEEKGDEVNTIDATVDDKIISDASKISLAEGEVGYVAGVAETSMPAIVAITNKSVQEVISWYGMGVQQYESESAGSGIIIGKTDKELLIATNAHVISKAKTLTVCFIDESVCEAKVKGSDEKYDVAVISVSIDDIDGKTLDAIKVIPLGDSDDLKIGEQVVAIGNALGYGQSVTTGIVSALARDITDDGVDNACIQTDAAINPGNSGGALLNMKGELVGINSAKLANMKVEGMGYAIPISAAKPIIDDLLSFSSREIVEEKDAGYVGISGFSVTSDVSSQYGIPVGIYVSETTKGAAADKAGIKKGDIITKFDGMNLDSIQKLRERLDYYYAGETVDITIQRADDGEYVEKTIKITLDGREGTPLEKIEKPDTSDADEPSSDMDNEDDSVEDSEDKGESNKKTIPRDQLEEYFNEFYGNGGSIFDFFGY